MCLNAVNMYNERGGLPNMKVSFNVCATFMETLMQLIHSLFHGIFSVCFLEHLQHPKWDFIYKTQNKTFLCCSKENISKSIEWKIYIVRNHLQQTLTIPEINLKWLNIFLISSTNLQKKYFFSKRYLCECREPFQKFVDSLSHRYDLSVRCGENPEGKLE